MDKKMRILWCNVILMLACVAPVAIGTGFKHKPKMTEMEATLLFEKKLHELSVFHFSTSLDYLFTGAEYANQKIEKRGMAKRLRELSDVHWKEGIETLKKHFSRGGTTKILADNTFHVSWNMKRQPVSESSLSRSYENTLSDLYMDSATFADHLNDLHRMSGKNVHDGDWQHFFEEKLEEEEKRKREMKGHITTFKPMMTNGLAVQIFDSNL